MPAPSDPMAAQPTVLNGRWRLLDKVGHGGMGSVHLARDEEEGRMVAVKLLSDKLSAMPEYVERFQREAKVMATFDHPNLVRLFGTGVENGAPFLVMELLTGRPLNKLLRPKLRLDQALAIVAQLCSGLTAMHERAFIHRDLKPANIFVGDDGHVTILDFGIARQAQSTLTKTGIVFGSPSYMSPEQIVGDKNLDPRSDIYSLGVVLYEMLTGVLPFQADDEHNILMMHLRDAPPDITKVAPEIPRGVGLAIQRAMSKSPIDRFGTAAEFWLAVSASTARVALPIGRTRTGERTRARPPLAEPPPDQDAATPPEGMAALTPPGGDALTPPGRDAPKGFAAPSARSEAPTKGMDARREEAATIPGAAALTQAGMAASAGATAGMDRLLGLRILQGAGLTLFVALSGYVMYGVLTEEEPEAAPVKIDGKEERKKKTDVVASAPMIVETLKPLSGIEDEKQITTLEDRRKQAEALAEKAEEEKTARAQLKTSSDSPSVPRSDGLRRARPGELRVTATVRGRPVSAVVTVDDKVRGRTPLYLPIKEGMYEFRVVYAGVKPWQLDLIVDTFKGQNFEVELDEKYLLQATYASSPEDRPIPEEQ